MYDRNNRKLLMLVLSCAAIVLGIYMTFFYGEEKDKVMDSSQRSEKEISAAKDTKEGAGENLANSKKYDYSDGELPTEDNESGNEIYNGGKPESEIYFSNTGVLDGGNMPLEAQKVLCSEVQKYLRHTGYEYVTELYIDDESYGEDAEKISFLCFLDGYAEKLQIEYWFTEHALKYYIVESDEYGSGGEDE